MLMTAQEIAKELPKRLGKAKTVDVAVAWVRTGQALKDLVAFGKQNPGKLRVIAGTAFNHSLPQSLYDLGDAGAIRLQDSSGSGVFHPKLYLFHGAQGSLAWVGSANLTAGAFSDNTELSYQFADNGVATKWFNSMWTRLERKDGNYRKAIDEYNANWTPGPRPKPRKRTPGEAPIATIPEELGSNWNEFYNALLAQDSRWRNMDTNISVLGVENSWKQTIQEAGAIIHRPNWDVWSGEDYSKLFGLQWSGHGGWGLLGGLKRANPKLTWLRTTGARNDRNGIHKQLHRLAGAKSGIPALATEALTKLCAIDGIGPSAATRLLALARPDWCVSVNEGSRHNLARLTQLHGLFRKQQLGQRPNRYQLLIEWVAAQPWHASKPPSDKTIREVWAMRAALLDAFVYNPT